MFSEPLRRAAMERARDEGQTIVSGLITLVQETPGKSSVQSGFLMYRPIYSADVSSATIDDRRRTLLGYAYIPVRLATSLIALLMTTPIGRASPSMTGKRPIRLAWHTLLPILPNQISSLLLTFQLRGNGEADRLWPGLDGEVFFIASFDATNKTSTTLVSLGSWLSRQRFP